MTDNVTFATGDPATPPASTIVATDKIGGVDYQRVKVTWGTDGTATDADTASGSALPIQVRNSTGTEIATATNPLRTDPTGTTAQPITDNGGSLTVDNVGTFAVQATQAGTWTVTQSGTWNVTNISGTVSLPTGAATAAKQPALGTAGTPSADVITVQGAASMTALKVDGSAVTQPVSNAGTFAVQSAQSGTWNVTNISGTISLPTGAATAANQTAVQGTTGSAVPANGLLVQGSDGTNARNISTTTAGVVKVDLSATAANTTAIKTDSSATTQPVSGTVTANAGTGTFATSATQSGTWTVQPGNTANTTPWLISDQAATSGGATPYKLISAATTNATSVKGSAGQIYMITASNVNAAARYLKLYNKASAPTVGTDTPVHTFLIPGNTNGAGTNIPVPSCGLAFGTGIAFALTTGVADADTAAVAASEIVVNLGYK